MEKKTFYVLLGYCGPLVSTPGNRKYGYEDKIVPVESTDEEIESVARSVGKGRLADSCVVYDNPQCSRYEKPFLVCWDCM